MKNALDEFKTKFRTQISGNIHPPYQFNYSVLEDWYLVTVTTAIRVVKALLELYQKQHQKIPISRGNQGPEKDWEELATGCWYKGEKNKDMRMGHGTCIYTDGTRYDGEWKDDKRNGLGVLTWDIRIKHVGYFWGKGPSPKNLNSYEGDWMDDQREGYGIQRDRGSGMYQGLWKNGQREGFGRYEWENANGKITNDHYYEGEWHHDKREGYGKVEDPKGVVFEGKWMNDRPVIPKTGGTTNIENGKPRLSLTPIKPSSPDSNKWIFKIKNWIKMLIE